MLTVWGRKTSSNVQALMWCIGELGLAYERHDAGHRFGGTETKEFLAMNPNGTVPVLRDGAGAPLWETGAILRYLAARYGRAPFWPADGPARAHIDKWAEWAKINVTLGFTEPVFWRVVRTAPAKRDKAAIGEAVGRLDRILAIAEAQLSRGAFLAGDDFTLADIQLGHVLFRYFDIAITRPERPALRRYYDALATRPAFREHVMLSYEELRVLD
jgi:glutathione S-transferase